MNNLRSTPSSLDQSPLFLALENTEETREFADIISSVSPEEMRDLDISALEKKWKESFAKDEDAIVSTLQTIKGNDYETGLQSQKTLLPPYNKFGLQIVTGWTNNIPRTTTLASSGSTEGLYNKIQYTPDDIKKALTTSFDEQVVNKATREYKHYMGDLPRNEWVNDEVFLHGDNKFFYRMDEISDFKQLADAYQKVFSFLLERLQQVKKPEDKQTISYRIRILLLRMKKIMSLAQSDSNADDVAYTFENLVEKCVNELATNTKTDTSNALIETLKRKVTI